MAYRIVQPPAPSAQTPPRYRVVQPAGPLPWSETLSGAGENIPADALRIGKETVQSILHPIETAKAIGDLALGGTQHAKQALGLRQGKPTSQMQEASAWWEEKKRKYGTTEQFKRQLKEHPVESALDILTPLSLARSPFTLSRGERFARRAPGVKKLEAAAKVKYDAAKKSGKRWSANEYDDMVRDIATELHTKGADVALTPGAIHVFKRMHKNMGREMTIRDLQILRRQAKKVQQKPDPSDAEAGRFIKESIDETIAAKVPEFKEANKLWARAKERQRIENLIEAGETAGEAQTSRIGAESGLRTQFHQVARPTEEHGKRRLRKYSPPVRAAIEKTARGTPGSNVLRRIGKFAPTGPVQFWGGLAGSGGAGYIADMIFPGSGPIASGISATGMLGTSLARQYAKKGTRSRAHTAAALAGGGGKLPMLPPSTENAIRTAGLLQMLEVEEARKRRGLLSGY